MGKEKNEKKSKKHYETTIPHTIKTKGIWGFVAMGQILFNQLDWHKRFRLTIEYEPEMLNSHIYVESD